MNRITHCLKSLVAICLVACSVFLFWELSVCGQDAPNAPKFVAPQIPKQESDGVEGKTASEIETSSTAIAPNHDVDSDSLAGKSEAAQSAQDSLNSEPATANVDVTHSLSGYNPVRIIILECEWVCACLAFILDLIDSFEKFAHFKLTPFIMK